MLCAEDQVGGLNCTYSRSTRLTAKGLVGGWMVEHLIMRGQNPAAIRIVDLQPPCRELAVKHNVSYFKADITDRVAVEKVFKSPWPSEIAHLPLTVFHTAAYIHAGYRKADFLGPYMKVNVEGTRNVLDAARSAGCDIFIATSSGSIGIRPSNFLFPPWRRYPKDFVQILDNAEPPSLDELENFAGCYAYSKAVAEKLVTDADDKEGGFRTGAIRPGHAIYGHGAENRNAVVYDYIRRGGLQT
jgi:nucleoside-diphosphate-sugar epimerase